MANPSPSFFACLWRYPLASLHSVGLSVCAGLLGAVAALGSFFFSDASFWRAFVFGVPHPNAGAVLGMLLWAAQLWICLGAPSREHIQPQLDQGFSSPLEALLFWACLPTFLISSIVGDAIARQPSRIVKASRPGLSLWEQLRSSLAPLFLTFLLSSFLAAMFARMVGWIYAVPTSAMNAFDLLKGGTLTLLSPEELGWLAVGCALWLLPTAMHRLLTRRPKQRLDFARAGRSLAAACAAAARSSLSPLARCWRALAKAREHVLTQGQLNGAQAQAERRLLEKESRPSARGPAKRL